MKVDIDRRVRAFAGRPGGTSSGEVAARLGISRQAAHRRLAKLASAGAIVREGAGRAARYVSRDAAVVRRRYATAGLAEDRVFVDMERRVPAIGGLPEAGRTALHYALTEMTNNAIEHSGARSVELVLEPRDDGIALEVIDGGVGALEHVRAHLRLASPLEAIQELAKGKTTTNPARHSGEGIFFTSKVARRFELDSSGLRWIVDNELGDTTVVPSPRRKGTRVRVELSRAPRPTLREVFDAYTIDEEFARTRTVVKLFAIGKTFVSRSEARRLMQGLDRFREVVLDFAGVDGVGQGFVDEVFRVWASAHEATRLLPVSMNEPIAFMIRRGLR